MSGKRLSKTEKLELLRRIVLHLESYRPGTDVRWIPVVQRFIERWNTRREVPATVQGPKGPPIPWQELVCVLGLESMLDHRCPGCNNPTTLRFLHRTASGALRCGDCRDRMTTEKKEN